MRIASWTERLVIACPSKANRHRDRSLFTGAPQGRSASHGISLRARVFLSDSSCAAAPCCLECLRMMRVLIAPPAPCFFPRVSPNMFDMHVYFVCASWRFPGRTSPRAKICPCMGKSSKRWLNCFTRIGASPNRWLTLAKGGTLKDSRSPRLREGNCARFCITTVEPRCLSAGHSILRTDE